MILKYYLSVYNYSESEGQNKPMMSSFPWAHAKFEGEKRYVVEVLIPDPECDGVIGANLSEEKK